MSVMLLLVCFGRFNAHDFPKEVVLDDRKLLKHLKGPDQIEGHHNASKAIAHAHKGNSTLMKGFRAT